MDEIYTGITTPDGTRLWNEGDRTLTTTKMAALIGQLCRHNCLELPSIPLRQRVMDAALGAEIGHKDGSLGNQLRQAGDASGLGTAYSQPKTPTATRHWLGASPAGS